MNQRRDPLRMRHGHPDHHRQNLQQRADHDLRHEAQRQQMSQRQRRGQPATGEQVWPLPEQEQRRQHQKNRRSQEKSQRRSEGRRLLQRQADRIHGGDEIRISKLPSARRQPHSGSDGDAECRTADTAGGESKTAVVAPVATHPAPPALAPVVRDAPSPAHRRRSRPALMRAPRKSCIA
jgi:hypothetical protein